MSINQRLQKLKMASGSQIARNISNFKIVIGFPYITETPSGVN